jgi:hypothetical protein
MNNISKEQCDFFYYIYPSISRKLDEIDKKHSYYERVLIDIKEERKSILELVNQYKKKIQRIELFLIKKGLIELLGKDEL